MPLSDVRAPVVAAGKVIAIVTLDNYDRENAFSDDDVRLLTTVCTSMGMALQSARLFDETQRLLKETGQRATEMAVINSIQQGIAGELSFQSIVDLVGDKLREVLKSDDMGIAWHDPATGLVHTLYSYEHGERLQLPPVAPLSDGPWTRMEKSRQPIVLNSVAELNASGYGVVPGTDWALSIIKVPIIGSDRVLGILDVENHERENAFGESEIRLLTTVASSMGVALENARLFDETQRLLKETEQRNAELAIINSVQEGLVAKMDMQGIYELVGDKIRDIFDAQVVDIGLYDRKEAVVRFPYAIERGVRFPDEPMPLLGFRQHVLETRHFMLINEDVMGSAAKYGNPITIAGEAPKSNLFVPMIVGDEAKGVISLQNLDREHAFSDSDVRLLQTLAN